MPKYRVTMTRDVTESATKVIDAATREAAERCMTDAADAGLLEYTADDEVFRRYVSWCEEVSE